MICQPINRLNLHSIDAVEQTVSGPEVAAGWCKDAFKKLLEGKVLSIDQLIHCLSDREINQSTAYSGILAPETADDIIAATSRQFLNDSNKSNTAAVKFKQLWACECGPAAQEEILAHPSSPICYFDNLVSFAPPKVQKYIKTQKTKADPQYVREMLDESKMNTKARCVVHGRECPIKDSDVHTAGNTCTDHSNFGKCDRMAGQHSKYFFIWAALMRQLKSKLSSQRT